MTNPVLQKNNSLSFHSSPVFILLSSFLTCERHFVGMSHPSEDFSDKMRSDILIGFNKKKYARLPIKIK
jgi:hypothetical protein